MSDRAILPVGAEFLDPMDEIEDHRGEWKCFLLLSHFYPPPLPAELVRIPDLGEPAVGLEQGSGRHPAPAAQGAPGVGPTPSQRSVEERAVVATEHTMSPLFTSDLVARYNELYHKLEPVLETKCPQFLIDYLAPLSEPAQLESEDSHKSSLT